MDWIILDAATVAAHLPADLAEHYATWLAANPDKAGRLGEIVANTVAEFRDNIRSNPANTLDPDEAALPQSCVRHAENIIFFQLSMELGLDLDTEGTQSMTRADIFLRQIAYKRFTTSGGDAATSPSPAYAVPETPTGRALPLLALAVCLLVSPAHAGWIANPRRASVDSEVQVMLAPQSYTKTTITLFGHLQGIDHRFASILPAITSLGLASQQGLGAFLAATNGTAYGGLNIPAWGEVPPATGPAGVGSEPIRFRGRGTGGQSYGADMKVGYYPEDQTGEWNLIISNTWNHKRGIVVHSGLLDLIAGPGLRVVTNAQGIPQLSVAP